MHGGHDAAGASFSLGLPLGGAGAPRYLAGHGCHTSMAAVSEEAGDVSFPFYEMICEVPNQATCHT